MQLYVSLQFMLITVSSIYGRMLFFDLGRILFDGYQPVPPVVTLTNETLDKGILLILGAALIVIVIYGAVAWRRIKS